MKLTDLNPAFVMSGGEGISDSEGNPVPERQGVGLAFDCPCGCRERVYLNFENPLDGGKKLSGHPSWNRTGDTFETISLTPSILRMGGCGWHGYLTNGELKSV